MGSCLGFGLSVLMFVIILAYGCTRGYFFLSAARPLISSYVINNGRQAYETIDLTKYQFSLAISVETTDDATNWRPIHDPEYVEWAVEV